MKSMENANAEGHYKLLVIAIVIGLFGCFFRFAGDASIYSWIANIAMIIGTLIAFKAVFAILK
ncbi:hypothetical protein EOD41_06485 [Mucilaginibacter limnophilus]|uniref:Gliding motility protein GldL n=1 Tax=Mucilaginibacter limnophilus TaxID=1932778 RepID=A0A3S2UQ08_9SPHI|nr:hypothetical protein [Mucilaginibacter limnophilus]RVU01608.1 hypothetical protein EOD41_06485 [Mucilaginibacter limnophilus]